VVGMENINLITAIYCMKNTLYTLGAWCCVVWTECSAA